MGSSASIISKPQPDPEIYEEKSTEWQNFTGFLAALGGCCLTREREMNDSASQSSDNSKKIANGPFTMVDGFVAEMTEMLVSSNVYVREGIKDTLGNDLSPTLFMLLFRHLEDRMKKCFDSSGQPIHTNENRLFVEQLVLVLRLILDRLVNPGDYLLSIDFSTLVRQFLDYLDRLSNTYVTLRIKIKACILIEALMEKKESIIIQNSIVLRNKMLETLVDWTSHVSLLQKSHEEDNNLERLQRDLDQACLKAIVNVLHQLPLQPLDNVRPADAHLIKSKLFLKHFNFFRKVLDGYKRAEREIMLMQQKGSLIKTVSESYQDIAQMKELTILAMSHLLSANVEAGLKYSLSMGYDDDQKTRTSFMQVLTNILDQGTEFETLAENVVTDRYEKLIDMLVNSEMEIALTLCAVCPSSDISGLAEILLICFESRRKIIPLLKAVVEREVIRTEQEATLFRGTTMATRLLSAYAKFTCVDYMRITLLPVMQFINTLPDSQLTWELDPQKLSSSEDVTKNKQNVLRVTEKLLQAICSSADNAPRIFREELELIAASVGSHFPEAKYTAVGGFVFLRLFGPAILSPETAGFAKNALPKNGNARKILLQATRIMQNLANNVLFGAKEPHMVSLNDFLTNNIYQVTSFLRNISTLPDTKSDIGGANLVMDQSSYIRLHKYLTSNLERISRDLTNNYLANGASTEDLLRCKKNLEHLSTLLAQLGRPSELANVDSLHARNYAVANNNHSYSDFMRRNAHRDLTAISTEHTFYMGGKSKEGRPVFYMFTRTLDNQNTDFELLTYYMLRVMEPYLNAPFELMYDTTGFTLDNAIPIHWLDQLFSMIFNDMNDYLVAVHILNPTTHLLRHMLKLPRSLLNKVVKRLHVYSSLSELSEAIEISEFRFSKATVNLEKNPSVTIYPVTRLTNQRISIPVIVKISSEELQIISMKKQEIFESYQAILRDVYHISQLEDITPLLSLKSDHGEGISIKHDRGKSTMVLLSPQRDAILAHLRRSKQRYESSRPSNIKERAIRPNDVPGRLLNMALVNVGSNDPSLRVAAYNLLYSLSQSFKFHIGNQLFSAKDMCIPSNSTSFIVSISENLALTELHLTLEFLDEAIVGLLKSNESMQQLCLDYMVPWWKNLESFARPNIMEEVSSKSKIREIIMSLINITMERTEHMQSKVWKHLSKVEEITGMVIDCFVQYSVEKGMGSTEAEMIADTFVTMGDLLIRGKLITRMRRVIEGTSAQPCRQLVEHKSWREITVLLRFGLMLSFNSFSGAVNFLPEVYHITTMVVVTGPTLIRSTVHKTVVNVIHNLCTTSVNLPEENRRKLHYILNDICDSKNRVLFGLTNQMANAFTITPETTTDYADSINLSYLQNIVKILIDTINYGATNQDIANKWRARWMSLVTSTAFYFNPAVQPRAFVVLGCLAQDEVDDDLLYQILVALKGALAIFVETEPHLIISIIMCLTNLIDNLPSDSRYLLHLFWLSVGLIQIGHPLIFQHAVEFLHSVLRALDSRDMFMHKSIEQVLLESRANLESCAVELDDACGVNFVNYFSFAIAIILLKGLNHCENKDVVYRCLCSFLAIESKHFTKEEVIEARALGYLTGLIPFAAKENGLVDLLQLACYKDIDTGNINLELLGAGLFDFLEIPDNSTALLFVSLLVALLNTSENESEKVFLYKLLAEAATTVPEVFSLAYEPLLPKMNQIVLNTQNHELLEAVKNILLTACSESAFTQNSTQKRTQKWGLSNLGFLALLDPTLGAVKTNITLNAKLA
ncbi:Ras GTPase activating protein ira2, partial [Rhizopus stolonifer]